MLHLAAVALALPAAAVAGTLDGRVVTLHVMTWDDPAKPFFDSRGRTVTVGAGLEFGMGPEHRSPDFDVVPVQVEIGPTRIEFSYPEGEGRFWPARFNGYVLRFETECALFDGWHVDPAATTMPVTDADIHTDRGALFVNVQGLDYGPQARLAVDLSVTDCPLS
jgi:hypothetical protein